MQLFRADSTSILCDAFRIILLFALTSYTGDSRGNKYFSRDDSFEGTDRDDNPMNYDYQRENLMEVLVIDCNIDRVSKLTVPRTLKNAEGSSLPNWHVPIAYAPTGKVKAHQPILNGNLPDFRTDAQAKKSQGRPKAQRISAVIAPTTYTIEAAELSFNVWVFEITVFPAVPSLTALKYDRLGVDSLMNLILGPYAKVPDPKGPIGKNTLMITPLCGNLCTASR
ncbi:uncharacterized protein CDV56_107956 [Aspergillus thermomutatus]|uniref:Uncharacterized protein n=1 Tax=Aspergillus thermomutatus TaxID=41047 RepID=A0A397H9D5_ASPTH|nr:uncharacterized protein CDV56_107956 [Aspergillus thermomutatus]RHZ59597.1 hypothetical protein CDV56_107956 [Aspergillus thermomutatus]